MVQWSVWPGTCIAGLVGQGRAVEAAPDIKCSQEGLTDGSREANPRAPHHAGPPNHVQSTCRHSHESAQEGRQWHFPPKGGQFLLPLRGWVPHSPEMAAMRELSSGVIRMCRADRALSPFAVPGTMKIGRASCRERV